MAVAPGGALGLGMLAGVWSVVGYVYIGPVLENKIGLQVGTGAVQDMPVGTAPLLAYLAGDCAD
jgi:hypothetical protein